MLDATLRQLTSALRDHISPGIGLWDPEDRASTPKDHYGQTAAALALTLLEGDDSAAARHALEAWRSLAPAERGHAPFNRFLLNLLVEHRASRTGNQHNSAPVRARGSECLLARRYPSNNWTLLARLCELQEARGSHRTRVARRLLHLLNDWSYPDGAFIDYPARPDRARAGATPAAYHHKALFVAVAAAEYDTANDWQPTVKRLLQWSLQAWDGHGHVGGLGRSSHALFGDACLVASLILLGANQAQARGTPADRMLLGILQRWQKQALPDGFIALNPADRDAPGTGWDNYMHLSVYNAWAAAIVAWARDRSARADRTALPIDLRPIGPTTTDEPQAAQFRVGNPSAAFALVSGRGQPPQAFSRSEVELRYAGGIPLHVTWQGRPLCPAPIRTSRHALVANAALAGWTPIFETEGTLFGLTDFDWSEIERSKQTVRIRLSGQPRGLLCPTASGLGPRALAALDWRLLGGALGRKAALHRPKLVHVTGHLEWIIHLERPRIEQRLTLENRGGQVVRYLNPGGHAVTSTAASESYFLAGSELAKQRQRSVTDAWLATPLPSATAGAIGRSLPSMELPRGRYHAELIVNWTNLQAPCESR
ncbi:hypothetical protein [Thioalkalivibrio sp. ALE31]|uniref:hypothetical protein n=1 Tax=Thioalkalivibrio sp. ALE31 TaxID=1158182 RepID=UPI000688F176|nr:hypothetical protein [Thioalkalivibrio sp. ALE31]